MSATELRIEADKIQDAIVSLLSTVPRGWGMADQAMLASLRSSRRRLLAEAADKESVRR